jgi:hypothetical protein
MTLVGGFGGTGGTTASQTLRGTVGNTFVNGDNYATLTVNTGSNGEVQLTYDPSVTQEADINGFQLVSDAPEPGTVGMALAGCLMIAGARLRRRQSNEQEGRGR